MGVQERSDLLHHEVDLPHLLHLLRGELLMRFSWSTPASVGMVRVMRVMTGLVMALDYIHNKKVSYNQRE